MLNEFALKFDEFGTPLDAIDCQFDFDRRIEKWTEGQEGSLVSADGQHP